MEIKRLNQTGTIVFGATLDEVEKDDKMTDIPKFVVECMKVIELEENIQTNGIYRASGKKDSIDKLRKRVIVTRTTFDKSGIDFFFHFHKFIR